MIIPISFSNYTTEVLKTGVLTPRARDDKSYQGCDRLVMIHPACKNSIGIGCKCFAQYQLCDVISATKSISILFLQDSCWC